MLAIKRDTYSRVYYLNYTASNSLSSLVPVFTTKTYEFSSLKIGISHNDTVNIAWISKHESSISSLWLSMIQLQRINLTTNEWLSEPLVLYNESNPNIMDLSSDYDSLHLTWTNSSDYAPNQAISHVFFNETTKLWSAYEPLTLSNNFVKILNTDLAKDKGLHILWAEGTAYSKLYYLKWFTNTSTTAPSSQINNPSGNNNHAYLVENDSPGDLHLVFEDAIGFLTQIYYRKMFINNGTWTPIVQLSTSSYSKEPIFLEAFASSVILGYLIYICDGTLVYQYLNTSEIEAAGGIFMGETAGIVTDLPFVTCTGYDEPWLIFATAAALNITIPTTTTTTPSNTSTPMGPLIGSFLSVSIVVSASFVIIMIVRRREKYDN